MRLLDRIRGLLLAPRATWDAIAAEGDTTRWLWRRYMPALVLLHATASLIEALLAPPPPAVRTTEHFRLRPDGSLDHVASGTSTSILEIHPAFQAPVMALGAFALMALLAVIARWLILRAAPRYGARPDRAAATKLVVYAQTGPAVLGLLGAAAATVLPWAGTILALGSLAHMLALFYLGAPRLLPPEADERRRFARVAVYRAVASGILLLVTVVVGTTLLGFLLLPVAAFFRALHPLVMT
jgi:hypothetical protein